ncbi:MAG: HEAT repeat domain-containing protein [Pirellulales bacterium]|nr:HEAT repeat domain-containing protein [Pirellulales bacterium]
MLLGWFLAAGGTCALRANAEERTTSDYQPVVATASDEGQQAISRVRVPEGLKLELVAAEPLLANPVAFTIDHRGRFYVAETFRLHAGVTDNRSHMYWLEDDLAARTVEDRVAMYRKHLGDVFGSYEVEHDRVRRVEDRDGDGVADHSTVLADGFHHAADGIGSGVLVRGNKIYYTCIPDLWLFEDADDDGVAEKRQSLHNGYGVHVAFLGHDLHGLIQGPDGKLYFSIGDRGLNVTTEEENIDLPDVGAVLRCNLDGSQLEVVATGLRNPQELAFNEFGDLFTGENNSDGGDEARLVQIVPGGDSGWRIGYQYINSPVRRGPWNEEQLWKPRFAREVGYLVPPIANFASGPSGLAYNPGTGLNERFKNRFFLCDFRGASAISGVRSFELKQNGASYELGENDEFVWSLLATDLAFGTDGALYISDWVEGWEKPNKGRIYRLSDPARAGDPQLAEVKRLLAEGMQTRAIDELTTLLRHADMRVRLEAQFELAARGAEGATALWTAATDSPELLARLHAIWGLGQCGEAQQARFRNLLTDPQAEVRGQAAKMLGESRVTEARDDLVARLSDESPRVRFFAALALARLNQAEIPVAPVVEMLRAHDDRDPNLRHAGVMALAAALKPLVAEGATDRANAYVELLVKDPSAAVRIAAVVALRRLESPLVARFLDDPQERVVLEAARAIYDVPIAAALPALAAKLVQPTTSAPLVHRLLAANHRLGGPEEAARVAKFAADATTPERMRVEALELLAAWSTPANLDRITGLWRPLDTRLPNVAGAAARPLLAELLNSSPDRVRQAAAELAGATEAVESAPLLAELAVDTKRRTDTRVAALEALDRLDRTLADAGANSASTSDVPTRLRDAVQFALDGDDGKLRSVARQIQARIDPAAAVRGIALVLDEGTIPERQAAFATLTGMQHADVDAVLAQWLDKLAASEVVPELVLDLLNAANGRAEAGIPDKLAQHEATRASDDPLSAYREALVGGDAERGRRVFYDKTEVACLRCHKIRGQGGDVGPDLTTISSRENREHLLEAIVAPNRKIAKGFETVVIATDSGQVLTGVLKSEDDERVWLMTPEGTQIAVLKSEIDERAGGASAMPDKLLENLSKAEVRDLVEFLSRLK